MTDSDRIAALLLQTGHAHHQAFIDVDRVDPDWPVWYADYLYERLPAILGKSFTKEQLAKILTELDVKQKAEAPDANWPVFYGEQLVNGFSAGQ